MPHPNIWEFYLEPETLDSTFCQCVRNDSRYSLRRIDNRKFGL